MFVMRPTFKSNVANAQEVAAGDGQVHLYDHLFR